MDLNIKEAFASQYISLSSSVEASATTDSEVPSVLTEHALVLGHGQGYLYYILISLRSLAINYRL